MDRRQQKTNTAILEAFISLLTRKNYSKITVQDIIDEANVGRTTFYAHFETKDALLDELCEHLFNHVFSATPGPEESHNFTISRGDFQGIVCHILYHLRDNGQNIARLLSGESSEVFQGYFRRYLNETVVSYLMAGFPESTSGIPEDFLRNHISGSFVNMVQWWFRGGMQQTPEQLSSWFILSMPGDAR